MSASLVRLGCVLAACALATCAPTEHRGVSCLDADGKPVEWWVLYKMPVLPDAATAALRSGLGYAYFDSNSKMSTKSDLEPIHKAGLDATINNPLKHTLDQIYEASSRSKTAFLMYNDELPCSEQGKSTTCDGSDTEACMATCPFKPYTKYNKIGLSPSECYSGKYDHTACNKWYCSLQGTFFAHSKGTLAFDAHSGFWLIHSLPRFPAPSHGKKFRFPTCLATYGQTFMCSSMPTAAFDDVGTQLRHMGPLVFDESAVQPKDVDGNLGNLQKVFDTFDREEMVMNKTAFDAVRLRNQTSQYQNTLTMLGTEKRAFMHVATEPTGSQVPHALWNDAVPRAIKGADSLGKQGRQGNELKGLFVETWRKGNGPSNDGKVSICAKSSKDYDYNVVNIGAVKAGKDLRFEFSKDHSKWAVTEDSNWLCIGDKNREIAQDKRGGGAMCTQHTELHRVFSRAIGKLSGDIWHSTKCSAKSKCKKDTQRCVKCSADCANGSGREEGAYYCNTQDTNCGIKP